MTSISQCFQYPKFWITRGRQDKAQGNLLVTRGCDTRNAKSEAKRWSQQVFRKLRVNDVIWVGLGRFLPSCIFLGILGSWESGPQSRCALVKFGFQPSSRRTSWLVTFGSPSFGIYQFCCSDISGIAVDRDLGCTQLRCCTLRIAEVGEVDDDGCSRLDLIDQWLLFLLLVMSLAPWVSLLMDCTMGCCALVRFFNVNSAAR